MRRRSKLVIQDLHYDPVERPTSAMRRKEYLDTMCFDYTSQRAVTATDEAAQRRRFEYLSGKPQSK